MFNFIKYLKCVTEQNKLVKAKKFVFTTCSGDNQLQGAIQSMRNASAYIVANDVCTGGTRKVNGGWQQRRQFSFFILRQFEFGNEESREAALDVCREIRRQFISKFLHDMVVKDAAYDGILLEMADSRVSFDMNDIRSTEFPDLQLNNCTGLYVLINMDEPINISYDNGDWL